MERRYKITETVNDYRVHVEVPKLKTKKKFLGISGEHYYDENDLEWRPVDTWGKPIYYFGYTSIIGRSTATFDTFKKAKQFVTKLKKKKLEVII